MSSTFFIYIIALLFSFFVVGILLGVLFSEIWRKQLAAYLRPKFLTLVRTLKNPILEPGRHPWMAEAVLNPAAAVIDGRTHLV